MGVGEGFLAKGRWLNPQGEKKEALEEKKNTFMVRHCDTLTEDDITT